MVPDKIGIEIEYMIVDRHSLDVRPISDTILRDLAGEYTNEFEYDGFAWSNELCLHVLELKTLDPRETISACLCPFQTAIDSMNTHLKRYDAMLMPGSAHPFMDPACEARLWPHGYNDVYSLYNEIFDCRGHGWVNLQATHLNIGFADEVEFAQLHAVIRFILPIIPGISASSPVLDGKITGVSDTRLQYYCQNQKKVPEIAGPIIPESAYTFDAYKKMILDPMYAAIARYDKNGTLQHEWLNSRGVIARFDRNAFEIRILDAQESVRAEAIVLDVVCALIRSFLMRGESFLAHLAQFNENDLSRIFIDVVHNGRNAIIKDSAYLRCFGIEEGQCVTGMIWQRIINDLRERSLLCDKDQHQYDHFIEEGPLSERILRSLSATPSKAEITAVYSRLAQCLQDNTVYRCEK